MIDKDDLIKVKKIIHKLKCVAFHKDIKLNGGSTVSREAIMTGKLMNRCD